MIDYFTRAVAGALLLCIAGGTWLFGQEPEVPVSTYGPHDQLREAEEVMLYDVTDIRPDSMALNRAHWTHGTAGVIYTQGEALPANNSIQLLTEDPAETYSLPQGKLQVALDLGDYYSIGELIFLLR